MTQLSVRARAGAPWAALLLAWTGMVSLAEEAPPEPAPPAPGLAPGGPPEPVPGLEAPEPAAPGPFRYRVNVRPALWLPMPWWSATSFRRSPGTAEVSLEDDLKADLPFALMPIEANIRTDNKEFRVRYVWWNADGRRTFSGQFGDVTFSSESVRGVLDTDVLSGDYLQRIVDHELFELYLTAGVELLATTFEMSGASGSAKIEAAVPIFTVGLGLRFPLRDKWSLFFSNSALSYADLFGAPDTFFPVKGVYRNVDLSLRQDVNQRFNWGFGWKHYEAGPENSELKAYQKLTGPSAWLSYRF